MYRILIVDDERIERDGIQKLIHHHQLKLETILAENGEAALEIIKNQHIDIMITDIKMPFIDGLELSEKAREWDQDLEIIIYSAYNEFEYARRALRTNVANYLLKPIQIKEFLHVVEQVIEACNKKTVEKLRNEELQVGYERGLVYEKEKNLLEALNGVSHSGSGMGSHDHNPWIHLVLMESSKKFFDIVTDDFNRLLSGKIGYPFDYVNLNEYQSVLFIRSHIPIEKGILRAVGEELIQQSAIDFSVHISLIFGKAVDHMNQLYEVFNEMEQMLEFKFFMEEANILFADEKLTQSNFDQMEMDSVLDKLYQCLDYNDIQGAKYSLDLLFSYFKAKGSYSSLYVKFICSEIMKKVIVKELKTGFLEINDYLDKISKVESLLDLKELIFTLITTINLKKGAKVKDDSTHKLIRTIKELIAKEYSQDISLDSIAETVFLSPSYLSYLFKKETDLSLIRYITQVRMEKAVELLTSTNMKIVDIYEQLGFRSATYFIQTFRNMYGVTPAKFREVSS